jgi:hypothetical protein
VRNTLDPTFSGSGRQPVYCSARSARVSSNPLEGSSCPVHCGHPADHVVEFGARLKSRPFPVVNVNVVLTFIGWLQTLGNVAGGCDTAPGLLLQILT